MNKARLFILFSITYFAAILLITAPAAVLAPVIHRISHGKLMLANCQGTVWQGSATPTLITGKQMRIALHTLRWSIRPQALLKGQLDAGLDWDDPAFGAAMRLTADRHAITLNNLQLSLPAEIIGELSPFLKPAQFRGNLLVQSPQLSVANNQLQGSASARWDQAGSALSAVYPLGNYRIEIQAGQNALSAVLTTHSGTLLLGGQGSWSPAQKFHFNGTASATPESQAMLSELLHHLGPEASPGVYQISL